MGHPLQQVAVALLLSYSIKYSTSLSVRLSSKWKARIRVAATWISRRSVHLARALRTDRPITAQEELPTQGREKPAQAVRYRFGVRLVGHAFSAAQQVALWDRFYNPIVPSLKVGRSILEARREQHLQAGRRDGGPGGRAGPWQRWRKSRQAGRPTSWPWRSGWGWRRSGTETEPTGCCAGAASLRAETRDLTSK